MGFLVGIAPLSIWLLVFAPEYGDSSPIIWFGYVTLGLMATLMTGNLMRHLWLGGEYQKFDLLSATLGLCILAAGFFNESTDSLSSIEHRVLLGVTALCALRVVHQGVSSYLEISTAPQN